MPKEMHFHTEEPRKKVPARGWIFPRWDIDNNNPIEITNNAREASIQKIKYGRWIHIHILKMVIDPTLMPHVKDGPNPYHEPRKSTLVFSCFRFITRKIIHLTSL